MCDCFWVCFVLEGLGFGERGIEVVAGGCDSFSNLYADGVGFYDVIGAVDFCEALAFRAGFCSLRGNGGQLSQVGIRIMVPVELEKMEETYCVADGVFLLGGNY